MSHFIIEGWKILKYFQFVLDLIDWNKLKAGVTRCSKKCTQTWNEELLSDRSTVLQSIIHKLSDTVENIDNLFACVILLKMVGELG